MEKRGSNRQQDTIQTRISQAQNDQDQQGWLDEWTQNGHAPQKSFPNYLHPNSTLAAPPLSFQTCWAPVSSHWHPQQPNLLPVASASSTGWSIGICPHPNFPQRPGSYNLPLCPVMKNGHFTFGRSNFSPRTFPNPLGKERVIPKVFATQAFLPKMPGKEHRDISYNHFGIIKLQIYGQTSQTLQQFTKLT